MKKVRWEWEAIDDFENSKTARVRVIGGWLVNHSFQHPKHGLSESTTFVPDQSHEWHIIKPMPEPEPVKQELPKLLKSIEK